MSAKLSRIEYWLNDSSVNFTCVLSQGTNKYSYRVSVTLQIPDIDKTFLPKISFTRERIEKLLSYYNPESYIHQNLQLISHIGRSYLLATESGERISGTRE